MNSDSVRPTRDDLSDRDALLMYLTAQHPGDDSLGFMSSYHAVLHDARGVTRRRDDGTIKPGEERHSNSWIGAVAYLSFLDQVGTAVTLNSQPKDESQNAIRLCLRDFAPHTELRDRDAIYALRCALVHDYSLFNINPDRPRLNFHFGFVANATDPLVTHAAHDWPGEFQITDEWNDTQTTVNLRALGDLAEGVNDAVMAAWHAGELQPRLAATQLVIRYGVFYDPAPEAAED